jgi:hypothetical protein
MGGFVNSPAATIGQRELNMPPLGGGLAHQSIPLIAGCGSPLAELRDRFPVRVNWDVPVFRYFDIVG